MRYAMPNFPGDFEIPDDWLTEAGGRRIGPVGEGVSLIFGRDPRSAYRY
jgi:hypothetical protein